MTRLLALSLPVLLLLFAPHTVRAQVGSATRECLVERMPATVFLDVERSCLVKGRTARLGSVLVTPSTRGADIYCLLRVGSRAIREVGQSRGCLIKLPRMASPLPMASEWNIKMWNKGKEGSEVLVEWIPPKPT